MAVPNRVHCNQHSLLCLSQHLSIICALTHTHTHTHTPHIHHATSISQYYSPKLFHQMQGMACFHQLNYFFLPGKKNWQYQKIQYFSGRLFCLAQTHYLCIVVLQHYISTFGTVNTGRTYAFFQRGWRGDETIFHRKNSQNTD